MTIAKIISQNLILSRARRQFSHETPEGEIDAGENGDTPVKIYHARF